MKKIPIRLVTTAFLMMSGVTFVTAQRVTVTLAGTGNAGYTGDGGSSKLADIGGPKDVCMDAAENIYFTDKGNGVIRRIDAVTGIITTIGGGGTSVADGVPATTAAILPNYMCMDATGNLYFTTGNSVKKIDATTGYLTTIAGGGTPGYTGDGAMAITATLNNPQGICIDATGNIYVADHDNNCIRKVEISTGKIYTVAGTGTAGLGGDGGSALTALLNGPVCVVVDAGGDVIFSDQSPNYPRPDFAIIRKITVATGIVTHIAGTATGLTHDVPAKSAILGTVTGLTIGKTGDLYINEKSCSCRKLNFTTDTVSKVAGDFIIEGYSDDTASSLANMNFPYGLCVDKDENVYIADSANQRIRKVIQVTSRPKFAYGHGVHINPMPGIAYSIDSLLWVTDSDGGQLLTWKVVTAPKHGSLLGFPTSAASRGTRATAKPGAVAYGTGTTYTGTDFFRVSVSDNTGFSDTVTVFIGNQLPGPLVLEGVASAAVASLVYPNPATTILNIQGLNNQQHGNNVVISDVASRIVYSGSVAGNNGVGQVNVATLPKGVYLVVVNGAATSKFVKE